MPIWVLLGKVQEEDTGEDDEESAEKRDCVYGVGGVEAFEKNEGCQEDGSGERDVVYRTHTAKCQQGKPILILLRAYLH